MKNFQFTKRTFIALALIIGLMISSTPKSFADDGLDEYNVGLGLYNQRRWDLAAKTFESFIKKFPDHSKSSLGKLYLGQTLVNLREYEKARTSLRDFVKASPQNVNALQAKYRIAECSYFLDQYPTAIEEFQEYTTKAPATDPLMEWALPYLGDAQFRSGKLNEAVETFKTSISKFPKGRMVDDCQFGLARAYESLKKPELAIGIYDELGNSKTSFRAAQARLNHGLILIDKKEYSKAANSFLKLEKDFPKDKLVPLAQINGGFAHYYEGNYQSAIDQFEKAAKSPQQKEIANYWSGVSYKKLGQYEKAIQLLKPLAENSNEAAMLQWAESELQNKNSKAAREVYTNFGKKFPTSSSVPLSIQRATEAALIEENPEAGLALVKQFEENHADSELLPFEKLLEARLLIQRSSAVADKNLQQSKSDLDAATKTLTGLLKSTSASDSTKTAANFHLARVQQNDENHAEAIATLEQMMKKSSDSEVQSTYPDAYLLQAISYFKLNQWKPASDSAETFVKLLPEDPRIEQAYSTLAMSLAHQDKVAESKQNLQLLANKFPKSPLLLESVYHVADLSLEKKNLTEAESMFDSIVVLGPTNNFYAPSLYGLGWSQFESKQFEKSAKSFETLAKLDLKKKQPLIAEAFYMQGLSHLRKQSADDTANPNSGDFTSLQEAAKIFTACYEQYSTAQFQGDVKRSQAINDQGFTAYEAAREAARAWLRLAKVENSNQAYNVAYKELKLLPDEKQKNIDRLLDEWALLNYNQQKYAESDRIYQLLIKENPNSDRADDAKLILAESEFEAGRIANAQKSFRELSVSPASDSAVQRRALFQLSAIALELADWKQLKEITEDYSKRFSDTKDIPSETEFLPEMQFRLATAELELGNTERSIELIKPIVDARTNADGTAKVTDIEKEWVPSGWLLLTEAYRRVKKYDLCRETSLKFESAFPNSQFVSDAKVSAGRCDISQAKFEDARKLFQMVLDKADGQKTKAAAQSQFYIAETYLMQKNFTEALPRYIRVELLYPAYPELQAAALFQAGQCDEILKEVGKAINSYEKLVKDYPDSDQVEKAKSRLKALKPSKQ